MTIQLIIQNVPFAPPNEVLMTASRILYNVHARQLLDKNDFMKPMVRVLAAFNTLADGLDRAVKG